MKQKQAGHETTEGNCCSNYGLWDEKLQKLQPVFAVSQLLYDNEDRVDGG